MKYRVMIDVTERREYEVKADSPQEAARIFYEDEKYQEKRAMIWLLESDEVAEEVQAVYDENDNEVTEAFNEE